MAVYTLNTKEMIEIILLIYLVRKNGLLAKQNELDARKWQIRTVLLVGF